MKLNEFLKKNKLVICDADFTIEYKNKLINKNGDELYGQTFMGKELIKIDRASKRKMLSTLFHELLHVIDESSHEAHIFCPKNLERDIDYIATRLAAFLIDNKILELEDEI